MTNRQALETDEKCAQRLERKDWLYRQVSLWFVGCFYFLKQDSCSRILGFAELEKCMCNRGFGSPRIWIPHPKTLADLDDPKGRFTIPKTQRLTTDDSPATCRGAVAGCRRWSPRPKRRSWARLNFCDRRQGRRPSFHRNVGHDFRRNYYVCCMQSENLRSLQTAWG